MYLHLDTNTVIRTREIVAILDIENSSVSKITREFFAAARSRGEIIYLSGTELPKSFLLCESDGVGRVYPIWRRLLCAAGWRILPRPCADFPCSIQETGKDSRHGFPEISRLPFCSCSVPAMPERDRNRFFVYYVRSGTDAGPGDHQRRIICGKQTYQRTV